jgi:DNA-binding IclR family transcriptional regulator
LDEYIHSAGLPSVTDKTITSAEQLKQELQAVKKIGVAFNREESTLGLEAIAAPVRRVEATIAAISLAYPSRLMTREQAAQAVRAVKATVRAITKQLSISMIPDAVSLSNSSDTL